MSELLPMYAAKVNSPGTELAADISATDTEITLVDASVLPDAPNLAVIGSDETAETVRYDGKDGNKLTGVERGFQGAAKSWSKGAEVARNFTAYDADAMRDNIGGLASRLDTADTSQITFQPGLQVISAERDARFNLGSIKGKSEINPNGRIGIVGVENPYVIRYGSNLLPPFYEWNVNTSGIVKVSSPYEAVAEIATAGTISPLRTIIPVLPNTTYTVSSEGNAAPGNGLQIIERKDGNDGDSSGEISGGYFDNVPGKVAVGTVTFTTTSQTNFLAIRLRFDTIGAYTIKMPMITLGSEAKPFKPREDSMLALQTELHAHPETGADPDELFEQNGQYTKIAKWKNVVITGSMDGVVYEAPQSFTGYKRIRLRNIGPEPLVTPSYVAFATKYNGDRLMRMDQSTGAGSFAIGSDSGNYLLMHISSADTGWGDAYTPTADEIKAYFMGWRMAANDNWGLPYPGTGIKAWGRIDKNGTLVGGSGTTTLPTVLNTEGGYTPYNLLYRLAKEVAEPVAYEGCLTLSEGDNVVEVGTGIVLRERANPKYDGSTGYYVGIDGNKQSVNASELKYKNNKILTMYKNSATDSSWGIADSVNAYGTQRAYIQAANFDQSAAYSVTYLKLDKSPIQPITGTVAANEKAQISDLTAGVAEALHGVSVLFNKKAEKDAPGWITPTLLNGYTNLGRDAVAYFKDSQGFVHLKGELATITLGSVAFVLPAGYRPKTVFYSGIRTYGSSGVALGTLVIDSSGAVKITAGQTVEGSIGQIVFLAEQ